MRQTFLMMLPWEKILDFSKMYTNEQNTNQGFDLKFRLILKLEINNSCKNVCKNAKISTYRNDFFQLVFFSSFLTQNCAPIMTHFKTKNVPSYNLHKSKFSKLSNVTQMQQYHHAAAQSDLIIQYIYTSTAPTEYYQIHFDCSY